MTKRLAFDRSTSAYHRSLAADRFRVDSTTINTHFWIGHLADGGLKSAVKRLDASDNPVSALALPPSVYASQLPHNVASLRERMSTHTRWRRLLTLVMLASALERYLDAVARIAIASDPLLTSGFPKMLDGAVLKKYGRALPARDTKALIVGEWSKRIATYEGLFGSVPVELQRSQGDLEFLRKSRNKVAHALGVDDGFTDDGGPAGEAVLSILLATRRPALVSTVSVSDERLIKLMATTQSVVDAVDRHLLDEFIGGYELVALLLDWSEDCDNFEDRAGVVIEGKKRQPRERFRNVLGNLFGTTKGAHYMTTLEQYVQQL